MLVVLDRSEAHSGTVPDGRSRKEQKQCARARRPTAWTRTFECGLAKPRYQGKDTDHILWVFPTRNQEPSERSRR
jgi:hypothetical protein